MARYLPEHFLESIYKYHINNFKIKPNYLQLLGEDHIREIVRITCLILSEEDIISNPYLGANYVELIFFFLLESKTGIMAEVFRNDVIPQKNLTLSLIKFYCDIAVTGSSNAFY